METGSKPTISGLNKEAKLYFQLKQKQSSAK